MAISGLPNTLQAKLASSIPQPKPLSRLLLQQLEACHMVSRRMRLVRSGVQRAQRKKLGASHPLQLAQLRSRNMLLTVQPVQCPTLFMRSAPGPIGFTSDIVGAI